MLFLPFTGLAVHLPFFKIETPTKDKFMNGKQILGYYIVILPKFRQAQYMLTFISEDNLVAGIYSFHTQSALAAMETLLGIQASSTMKVMNTD